MLLQKNSRGILFLANKDVHQMQTNKSLKMTKMTKKKHLTYKKKRQPQKLYKQKKISITLKLNDKPYQFKCA